MTGRNTHTLAYEISNLLNIWPIVFVVALSRSKKDLWRILGIAAIGAFMAFQIYFQKRAPSARAITYFLMAVLVLRNIPALQHRKILLWAALLLVVVVMNMPTEGLESRFSQINNLRLIEAKVALNDFDSLEIIAGRGMGGYFLLDEFPGVFVETMVNENGQFGRTKTHMGVVYPIIKGGILFLAIHIILVWPFFARSRNKFWRHNKYNSTSLIVLPVYVLFRLIEGPFSTGVVFDGVIFGLCVARAPIIIRSAPQLASPKVKDVMLTPNNGQKNNSFV